MHKNWTTNDLKMDVDPRMQRTRNARSTKFNDPQWTEITHFTTQFIAIILMSDWVS